jgi:hypothetical protein
MVFRCPHCQNNISPSEYKAVYRCGYCHIWLREDQVIKLENNSSDSRSNPKMKKIRQEQPEQPEQPDKNGKNIGNG